MVPGEGLEPSLPKERDFESLVSTISPPRQILPDYYSEKDVFTRLVLKFITYKPYNG
jgi:hypothetical protein